MSKLPKPRFTLKFPKFKSETLSFLVLRFGGKKLAYSTGMFIRPKDWDFDAQRPIEKARRRDLWTLHRKIDDPSSYSKDVFIESDFGNISLEEFKKQLDNRILFGEPKERNSKENADVPTFLEFLEEELAEMKKKGMRKNSLKTFKTHVQRLKEYASDCGKFTYEDVDWNFRLELIDWLETKNMQLAYGNKTLATLRQFLERARRKKYHSNVQYQGSGWTIPQKSLQPNSYIGFTRVTSTLPISLHRSS